MSESPADKEEGPYHEAVKTLAAHIGKLYALNVIQARALNKLAASLKADPAVSRETHESAKSALDQIDRLITLLKDASLEIDEQELPEGTGEPDEQR